MSDLEQLLSVLRNTGKNFDFDDRRDKDVSFITVGETIFAFLKNGEIQYWTTGTKAHCKTCLSRLTREYVLEGECRVGEQLRCRNCWKIQEIMFYEQPNR